MSSESERFRAMRLSALVHAKANGVIWRSMDPRSRSVMLPTLRDDIRREVHRASSGSGIPLGSLAGLSNSEIVEKFIDDLVRSLQ